MTSPSEPDPPPADPFTSSTPTLVVKPTPSSSSHHDHHDHDLHASFDDSDPTDFEGQTPVWGSRPTNPNRERNKQNAKNSAVQGASAAGARALTTQLVAFYFRYPVKAFMRLRVDYMQVARAINPHIQSQAAWSLRQTTFGVLAHAVQSHGWSFIPRQVLPPLVANVGVGMVLYTSYLQILGQLHEGSGQGKKRVYPPPPILATFAAGAGAGAIQSVIAAPLDAISTRFDTSELLEGKFKSIWEYSIHKLREVGLRGVFAGYGLSFVKETLSYGLFFSSFEAVKQQGYYRFLVWYYGNRKRDDVYLVDPGITPAFGNIDFGSEGGDGTGRRKWAGRDPTVVINPHWSVEPVFLLLAGATASITSMMVLHPMTLIQQVHYNRLESIDLQKKTPGISTTSLKPSALGVNWWTTYRKEYGKTYNLCQKRAIKAGGWRKYLYRGFLWTTLRTTPSTAAALIIFELMRRKFGEEDKVKIMHEGFDIQL